MGWPPGIWRAFRLPAPLLTTFARAPQACALDHVPRMVQSRLDEVYACTHAGCFALCLCCAARASSHSQSPGSPQWDVQGRGKHNGYVKGVQYFACPEGCGSFVRAETVIQPSSTFQDAFIERYASDVAASAIDKMDFREAAGKKAAVICELVGKDREVTRLQNTAKLKEVTLTSCKITCVGDAAWVREHAAGVESLVLDDNLFTDWSSVSSVVLELPQLSTLSLNGNRLQAISASCSSLAGPLLNLRKLSVNGTGVNFAQVQACVPIHISVSVSVYGYDSVCSYPSLSLALSFTTPPPRTLARSQEAPLSTICSQTRTHKH
jgi:hypothetical protein